MHIPKPPWYNALGSKLEGSAWAVDTLLVIIILVSVILLLSKDHVARTAWAVYLVSP